MKQKISLFCRFKQRLFHLVCVQNSLLEFTFWYLPSCMKLRTIYITTMSGTIYSLTTYGKHAKSNLLHYEKLFQKRLTAIKENGENELD